MSEMSRGSLRGSQHPVLPVLPALIPSFREAIPGDPHVIPTAVPSDPRSAPHKGERGARDRGAPQRTALGRRPQLVTCHTCGATILTALDADRCAITAKLDPYPLTPHGEVWALQAGRPTYLVADHELTRRDRWNIPGRPPSRDRTVLTWHQCDQPPPPEHRRPTNPPAPRRQETDECPF